MYIYKLVNRKDSVVQIFFYRGRQIEACIFSISNISGDVTVCSGTQVFISRIFDSSYVLGCGRDFKSPI